MKRFSLGLFFPIVIFFILFIPYIGSIPYRDGAIEFIQSYNIYHGGLQEYMNHWGSVHPPMKYILLSGIYHIFGVTSLSYTVLGLVLGILTLLSLYFVIYHLFNKQTAYMGILFLALSPLFLSVGIFSMLDYVATCFLLLSLVMYIKQKYFFYSLAASALVLSKETGLVMPVIIFLIELFTLIFNVLKNKKIYLKSIGFYLIPLIVFFIWLLFLQTHHQKPWNDYIFSPVASHGAFYVVLYNLFTGQIFNPYAFEHWKQVFLLNFNWVYWGIMLIALVGFLYNRGLKNIKKMPLSKVKYLIIIVLFCVTYLITVLALQTYTIPRYELPIYPFLCLGLALAVSWFETMHKKIGSIIFSIITLLLIFSLFTSIDPLSKFLWRTTVVQNQSLYAINHNLAGNDGITYNMQYLFLIKERSNQLLSLQNRQSSLTNYNCQFLFHDPSNDRQVFKILHLENIPITDNCPDYSD